MNYYYPPYCTGYGKSGYCESCGWCRAQGEDKYK